MNNRTAIVRLLLEASNSKKVNTNSLANYGTDSPGTPPSATPLHLSVQADTVEIARLLVAAGADPNAADRFHRTPLHYAMQPSSRPIELAQLLLAVGAEPNVSDLLHQTPLHLAASANNTPTMRLLLASGSGTIDVNARSNYVDDPLPGTPPSVTPLHFAAQAGFVEAARLLLAAGATPNAVDRLNQTPLHIAVFWKRTDVVKLLLNSHSKVRLRSEPEYWH